VAGDWTDCFGQKQNVIAHIDLAWHPSSSQIPRLTTALISRFSFLRDVLRIKFRDIQPCLATHVTRKPNYSKAGHNDVVWRTLAFRGVLGWLAIVARGLSTDAMRKFGNSGFIGRHDVVPIAWRI
jgi:hypothetical protein